MRQRHRLGSRRLIARRRLRDMAFAQAKPGHRYRRSTQGRLRPVRFDSRANTSGRLARPHVGDLCPESLPLLHKNRILGIARRGRVDGTVVMVEYLFLAVD